MLVGYSNCLKKNQGEKNTYWYPADTPRGEICSSPMKSGRKKITGLTHSTPRFFLACSAFFFFFPFFPSFFLVPVSPPINAANKNNERPPAHTLHPLSVGAHSLVEWRAGEVWFAVRKGRRLLLQTASRQQEDTGLCRVSFHPFSRSLSLLSTLLFSFSRRGGEEREKKKTTFDLDPRNRECSNIFVAQSAAVVL